MHNSPSINSHFNTIMHMIGNLPQGHEKPLKHALYNAIALFLLCLCCAVGYALFLVLEPFFKPLLWALLLGSLLHPIKHSVSEGLRKWFTNLESSNRSLLLGFFVLPIDIANELFRFVEVTIRDYFKIAAGLLLFTVGSVWLYNFFPWGVFRVIWQLALYFNKMIGTILYHCNTVTFASIMMGYLGIIYFMWNEERENFFRKTSLLVWLFFSSYVAHLTGSLQAITFIFLQMMALLGFILEIVELRATMCSKGRDITVVDAFRWTLLNKQNSLEFQNDMKTISETTERGSDVADGVENKTDSVISESYPVKARLAFQNRTLSSLPISTSESKSAIENYILAALQRRALSADCQPINTPNITTSLVDEADSSFCFKYLLWACGGMLLWKHTWIWPLILVGLTIFIIKSLGYFFGVWAFLGKYIWDAMDCINSWGSTRYSAIVPAHINGIIKLIEKLNLSIYEAAKSSIDSVSSITVIFALILFLICAPIFMGVQIYSEGITVIQLTSNLINSTVVHNPELRQLLPPGWDETMESLLGNAYVYGREGLSETVRNILQDTDEEKRMKLEKQVLELWDKIYQTWMTDNLSKNTDSNSATIKETWESFVLDVTKTPEMLNTNALVDFAKQNVGTLLALLDSLWSLLKGNISLVLGSLSTMTSVILGGSTAVLNFILSLVVFFTTLFYLLNSSSALYKPIELISKFSPTNGPRFGLALTDAVNGVFKATLKMAIFYGLWTWLIHNLFGAKIIYLPSALAAILAAVPFLGTYLACIPAVLDLWLAQESPILAILLAVCQFAPSSYVDTVIYKEIKNGGHPYFTGLAIAGGIFCLGVEGAIFGPLLLCCLLVALNLSSTIFKETPMEEQAASVALQNRFGDEA